MSNNRPNSSGETPEEPLESPDSFSKGKSQFSDKVNELREQKQARQEASIKKAQSDPLEASKSRSEKLSDFGIKKINNAKSSLGDKVGSSINKAAENDGISGTAARGVQTAQKAAQIAKNTAQTFRNLVVATKSLLLTFGNPIVWIAIGVVLALIFTSLAVLTGVQVYGKNDSVQNCSSNGSVSNIDVPTDASAEENRDLMMSWLMQNNFKSNGGKPLTKEQASAVAGNFQAEAGFGFKVTEGHKMDGASNEAVDAWTKGGPRGLGMAQWTWNPGRAGTLIQLAKSMNKNWYDPEVQFQMILNEMDGAYGPRLASAGFFKTGGKPGELAIIFHDVYEGSADTPSMKQRRAKMAEDAFANAKVGGYNPSGGDNCQQSGSSVGADCFPVPGKAGFCYPMEPGLYPWKLTTYAGHAFEAKDMPGPEGTPVHVVRSGKVISSEGHGRLPQCPVSATTGQWPQWTVIIELDEPYEGARTMRYTHFKEASPLKAGDSVKAGDFIGYLGTSGCSTGPHLHMEFEMGSGVDPRSVFGSSF